MALIETHISWVLLTGPFAYKIKKPVDLGFLDFTALEARRRFCEEEIRINRRLAPEIYLGVVPITGTPEAPRLGGQGEPFEYAVKMLQFPEEDRLDHRLRDGRLQPSEIDELAELIADFHGRVDKAPADSPFGTPETIRNAVDECLDPLKGFRNVETLRAWCGTEFGRLEEVFRERKAAGFVREGHGDLHLANIVFFRGRAVPFDAIEFSETLRWIDVMNEIAFTVMDLEERGAEALAGRFLNLYLEKTGDYEGLRVLRYYKVYRALVRAKVAQIRTAQGDRNSEKERDDYLDQALRFTRPDPPRLWITHGLSGSGKTHGTQKLLEDSGAIRVRTDVERRRMFGSNYSPEATLAVYGRLAEIARLLLREGYPVITDGTFLKRSERDAFLAIAQDRSVPFRILDFQAPESVLRERVLRRRSEGRDASEADLKVLEMQKAVDEPLSDEEKGDDP
jgi:hypothetical protein